jgi:hypothetical protein
LLVIGEVIVGLRSYTPELTHVTHAAASAVRLIITKPNRKFEGSESQNDKAG